MPFQAWPTVARLAWIGLDRQQRPLAPLGHTWARKRRVLSSDRAALPLPRSLEGRGRTVGFQPRGQLRASNGRFASIGQPELGHSSRASTSSRRLGPHFQAWAPASDHPDGSSNSRGSTDVVAAFICSLIELQRGPKPGEDLPICASAALFKDPGPPALGGELVSSGLCAPMQRGENVACARGKSSLLDQKAMWLAGGKFARLLTDLGSTTLAGGQCQPARMPRLWPRLAPTCTTQAGLSGQDSSATCRIACMPSSYSTFTGQRSGR